jgi:hypothetical protein
METVMDMNRFAKRLLLMVVVAASAPAVSQQMPWRPQTLAECEARAARDYRESIEKDCARKEIPEWLVCRMKTMFQYRIDLAGCRGDSRDGTLPGMPVLPPPPAPPRLIT